MVDYNNSVSDLIISAQVASFVCPRTDCNAGRSWPRYARAEAPAVSDHPPGSGDQEVQEIF